MQEQKNGLTKEEIKQLQRVSERRRAANPGVKAPDFDFYIYLLVVLVAALFIRLFIGEPVYVSGDSMVPTLVDQERVLVEKVTYYFRAPGKGEIVVCHYPGVAELRVKRVIANAGDMIEVKDGAVYVNDVKIDESAYWRDEIFRAFPRHQVKEGHVFVMGDNRNHSADSRSEAVGDIPVEKIAGRAVCVFWPFDKMRSLS